MKNKQILVVDDTKVQSELIKIILKREGYYVNLVNDGLEALKYLHDCKTLPDLIISDIEMPNMNGFELCSKIKEYKFNIPIVIITAYKSEAKLKTAFELGAQEFISTPFTKTAVLTRVSNVLEAFERMSSLGERIKELNCLYEFSKIVEIPNITITGIYSKLLNLIPRSFQYPELTSAMLTVDKDKYISKNFIKTDNKIESSLIINNETVGSLEVFLSKDKNGNENDFLDFELLLINSLTERLGRISERFLLQKQKDELTKRLYKLVMYDSLTGALNKTPFFDLFDKELKRAKRTKSILGLIFIDLDNFKSMNDTYGHIFGDLVLHKVSNKLKECLRSTDFIGRFGGDEFIICLNNVSSEESVNIIANKIQSAFNERISIQRQLLKVEFSLGIAVFPKHGGDTATLLKYCDNNMYNNKMHKKTI